MSLCTAPIMYLYRSWERLMTRAECPGKTEQDRDVKREVQGVTTALDKQDMDMKPHAGRMVSCYY